MGRSLKPRRCSVGTTSSTSTVSSGHSSSPPRSRRHARARSRYVRSWRSPRGEPLSVHDDRTRFEGVVREHSGRVLAALTGQFRDLGLAEDSLQEAWLLAAERWPVDGWPTNPAGWAYTVARRRALDRVARESS